MKKLAALWTIVTLATSPAVLANQISTQPFINAFPQDALSRSVGFPLSWAVQYHQNKCDTAPAHGLLWNDQCNDITADHFILISNDASILWELGFGGPWTTSDQVGAIPKLSGTEYRLLVTITPGMTNAQVAQDFAARMNGGLQSATVANAGTNVTNGATYALNVADFRTASGPCLLAPKVIATSSGGVLSSVAVTPGQGSTWGGVCTGTIPDPVGLVGTDATVHPVQAPTTYTKALAAFTDVNGFPYQPNAAIIGSATVAFDFPFGTTNLVQICSGTNSQIGIPQSPNCPGTPHGDIAGVGGSKLDGAMPYIAIARNPIGYAPSAGDLNQTLLFESSSGPSTGADTIYAGILNKVAAAWTDTANGAAAAGQANLTLTVGTGSANGWQVTDQTNPAAIPNGTTVLSGGGTVNIALSANIANQGVSNLDTITFTDPTNPRGRLDIGVSNEASAKNFSGTTWSICGGIDCNGMDVQLNATRNGSLIAGAKNPSTGASAYAAFQAATGTPGSDCLWQVKDLAGSPVHIQLCDTAILTDTSELSLASNAGSFIWKNIASGGTIWGTLNKNGYNLGSGETYQINGAQIACANLSNAAASCSTDATNATNISSGTLPAARLPNPTASTLGGVESIAAVASNWVNSISTSGVPSLSRPACADLSNSVAGCSTAVTRVIYSTHGTQSYTRTTGAVTVRVRGCGGGGGGGGGALELANVAASGGGGGGGGGCFDYWFAAADVGGSAKTVTIGTGGAGGIAQTTNTTAGPNGSPGTDTCFGGTTVSNSLICGGAGGGGAGGQLAATASGGGGGGCLNEDGGSSTGAGGGAASPGCGNNGGAGAAGLSPIVPAAGAGGGGTSIAGVANGGGLVVYACGAGGSGGGLSAVDANNNGGPGDRNLVAFGTSTNIAGGTSGTPTGGSGSPQFADQPGFGGGGGFGNGAGNSGTGGLGTQCGGGGGGGTAVNGNTAGAGAAGGDGWIEITEYFS